MPVIKFKINTIDQFKEFNWFLFIIFFQITNQATTLQPAPPNPPAKSDNFIIQIAMPTLPNYKFPSSEISYPLSYFLKNKKIDNLNSGNTKSVFYEYCIDYANRYKKVVMRIYGLKDFELSFDIACSQTKTLSGLLLSSPNPKDEIEYAVPLMLNQYFLVIGGDFFFKQIQKIDNLKENRLIALKYLYFGIEDKNQIFITQLIGLFALLLAAVCLYLNYVN